MKCNKNNLNEKKNEIFENLIINNLNNHFILNNSKSILNIYFDTWIYCMKLLINKKLAIGVRTSILFIINNENFNIDLKINNNKQRLYCIEQIKNGNIILSFSNGDIRIIKISNNSYEIIQDIYNAHNYQRIYNIIELKNNINEFNFISCSEDKSIKLWSIRNNNNIYEEIFQIKEEEEIFNIKEIKNNIIIYDIYKLEKIKFYDIQEKKEIKQINNLKLSDWWNNFIIINNKVIICGNEKIYFIDINTYLIIKEINYNCIICSGVKINENSFIIGDYKGNLVEFNINNDAPISIKNNAHIDYIRSIIIYNNILITGGEDKTLKFWK